MIRKAVIPAAGFGTRFLPATKSQPKEMLPLVDTPVIQYVVEEAVAAGITDIIMVIGAGKRAIEEHFDRSWQLERLLEKKGKTQELKTIRRISEMADIHFIWQKQMNGLGDAVYCARHHVGREPFAVLLGDTVMDAETPPIGQLIDVYNKYQGSVVLVEEVPPEKVSRYGVIEGQEVESDTFQLSNLIEKPSVEEAPSNLAIASRYILLPEIFDSLQNAKPGKGGEIQLTDAMRHLLVEQKTKMHARKLHGRRCDIGNKEGFVKTNIEFALKRPDMAEEMTRYIIELAKSLKGTHDNFS